jgi:hypothetical protein
LARRFQQNVNVKRPGRKPENDRKGPVFTMAVRVEKPRKALLILHSEWFAQLDEMGVTPSSAQEQAMGQNLFD